MKECVRYVVNKTKAKSRRESDFFCKTVGDPLRSVAGQVLPSCYHKKSKSLPVLCLFYGGSHW